MALLNPKYLKSIVAIGNEDKKGFSCFATGFLVGFLANQSKFPEKRKYHVFLVTNAHVFKGKKKVSLRLNTKDGTTKVYNQDLIFSEGEERWLAHRYKDVDLALLYVSPAILDSDQIDYEVIPEELLMPVKKFEKEGISVGDEIYIVGFPLGVAGEIQNYPYPKLGIIARKDKEIIRKTKSYLVDSSIFPGNSGGPVFIKPNLTSLEGTKSVQRAYCIGVVTGYIPHEEMLYSFQTDPPTPTSKLVENSGLSRVIPVEYAQQIFNKWKKANKPLEQSRKEGNQESRAKEVTRHEGDENDQSTND